MNKRFTLIAIVLFLIAATARAQEGTLRGIIHDAKDSSTVPGVSVGIQGLDDTGIVTGTSTDMDGLFMITSASGRYRLSINSTGYSSVTRTVTLTGDTLDLGTIFLAPDASALKTVVVKGEVIRAQQNGDTSQFNAGAYKTNPDANAEDLVTKMPGVTNDASGLKVNGETVQQVLVDGKPFFGDDPNAALKNLPAEIIDKIQIFDKQSDQSQFTGFDDGNASKTLNIVTKRGRNNGVFGKISAGYGVDEDNNDGRYTVGGNLNFFNGDRRISLVGLANNVNQQNFSSEDLLGVSTSQGRGGNSGGGGRGGGRSGGGNSGGGGGGGDAASNFLVNQQGGITQTQSAGINYSDSWGKRVKVSGSYFFNRAENTSQTMLTRSYIVSDPDSALIYHENGTTHSTDFNHRANFRLEWTIDSFNSLVLNPKVSYQDNTTSRSLLGRTTLGAESSEQSNILNEYYAANHGYNLNNQLTLRHRFHKQGRTISLNFGTTYNSKTGTGTLYSDNAYAGSDTTLTDQHNELDANGLTLSGNLTYTEPLTRKSQLSFTYSPSYNKNNSDRETYNITAPGVYNDLDTLLSNKYDNRYYYQRGGLGYRYNDTNWSFNAGLNAQYATLDGTQAFPYALAINRNFSDLLPSAMFNYKFTKSENIRVMYRTNTNAPSITQLQNIVDNSNPLLLRTGNPDLRQDYTHSLSIRYGKTNSKAGTGLFIFANGSYVNNYIGNSTVLALSDTTIGNVLLNRGTQLSRPVNLNGAYTARTFITYSLPLRAIKTNLNTNAGFTYNRLPAIINGGVNKATSYGINGGIVLGSNISENVDFTLSTNGTYSIVENTLQSSSNYNYYTQNSALRFNWIFAKNFVANTNLTHTFYSGLGSAYDQSYLLWNASLGYKFGKGKSWQADLYAFDILKQNRSISRTVSDAYIEDASTQVLQRYFMLKLTYTIRKFAAGASMPADDRGDRPGGENGGRRGFRGDRPGGPPPGGGGGGDRPE